MMSFRSLSAAEKNEIAIVDGLIQQAARDGMPDVPSRPREYDVFVFLDMLLARHPQVDPYGVAPRIQFMFTQLSREQARAFLVRWHSRRTAQ